MCLCVDFHWFPTARCAVDTQAVKVVMASVAECVILTTSPESQRRAHSTVYIRSIVLSSNLNQMMF